MSLKSDIIETKEEVVKCNGGGLPLGHPQIYLNFGLKTHLTCPYCSQQFIKANPLPKAEKHTKKKTLSLLLACFLLQGCSKEEKAQLANPASTNCVSMGGRLQIAKRGDEGEYGICLFEDNRQCEEWALFRGECPKGGVKVTGYKTPEGIYCAIKGGQVLNNETECQLPSGQTCPSKELYNGVCPPQ